MHFVFAADLHGNVTQYEKVFSYAQRECVDIVCIAGDITPKNPEQRTPQGQKNFLKNYLFPSIKKIKDKVKVLLIMGNDDYKANYDFLIAEQKAGYRVISESPVIIDGYYFVGYSYVPYTPYKWKDWEKRDLDTDTVADLKSETRKEGFLSVDGADFLPYNIVEHMGIDSIEKDLEEKIKDIPADKLILVTHAPPYNTDCDYTKSKNGGYVHVGSRAVYRIIERYQPLLTVHGHIHDTVQNTGAFPFKIRRTYCVAVSSDHIGDSPYIVCGNINNLPGIKRIKL